MQTGDIGASVLGKITSRAGQGRAGQGRAGQGRAGQGRAGQGRAGQGRAGQGKGRAKQGKGIAKEGNGMAKQGKSKADRASCDIMHCLDGGTMHQGFRPHHDALSCEDGHYTVPDTKA